MATSTLLRKQSLLTSSSSSTTRTLSALSSLLFSKQQLSTLSSSITLKNRHFYDSETKSTHLFKSFFEGSSCMLQRFDFKASYSSQAARFVVADYSDDDKVKSGGGGGDGGGDQGLEISKLNIHKDIVSCLSNRGITKLFPIQRAVLEPAMQGCDMIGRAKTGTGKTLAFGIPILDKITRHNSVNGAGRDPLALVLAPTRELAKQVEKEFYESSKLDTLCVYGGTPISRQMNTLSRGVDVVAGTPGRVIDLIKRGALNLSQVQFVVLDEADQMLNVGFEEDVEVILEKLPQKRQTLMFSATMPSWIMKLTRKYLKDPVMIDLVGDSDQKLAEGISLYSVLADHHTKAGVVGPLVTEYANGGKCIVFTQTKRDADNLSYALARKNYRCEPLHGDISQSQRERTLKRFRDGDINVLIATDVAARGLDIPNVDLIIHYELPNTSESFVHRSGRTGRAGKKGTAITIYTRDQQRAVKVIERDVGCKFQELPAVESDGTEMNMGFGGGNRSGGYGNPGFNRSGGFGNYGAGRYGGDSYLGRGGGYSNMNSGSSRDSGFNRSGGFGNYGASRDSGFGQFGSRGSNSFNKSGSGRASGGGFGDFGRESSGFGKYGSSRNQNSGGFGSSNSSRYGGDDQF